MDYASLWHHFEQFEGNWFTSIFPIYLSISAAVLVLLLFVKTPYGRYSDTIFGFLIPAKFAWFSMEVPTITAIGWFFLTGKAENISSLPAKLLLAPYIIHYIHRVFIYPAFIRSGTSMPFLPWALAAVFSVCNGYYQGRYLGYFASYPEIYATSETFVIGLIIFFIGMAINIHSDYTLIYLRKPGQTGYFIPTAGCFRLVSGANFFGEIIEWFGYAVASNFSPPALAFSIFTACNVGPRAIWHHRWYQEKFKDAYPTSRKALIPFVL